MLEKKILWLAGFVFLLCVAGCQKQNKNHNNLEKKGLEFLDIVLDTLYKNYPKSFTSESLKGLCFKDNDNVDVEGILSNLKSDLIVYEKNDGSFAITPVGMIYKDHGGFKDQNKWEAVNKHPILRDLTAGIMAGIIAGIVVVILQELFSRLAPKRRRNFAIILFVVVIGALFYMLSNCRAPSIQYYKSNKSLIRLN